jgi:probable dihydroxyacetone kinase regulator
MSESLITKRALAAGLKELMKTKNFDKISVADIAGSCGLNRQTFYYHFQDKFDLVNWIYFNELISIVADGLTFENWDSQLCEILTIMKKDQSFFQTTLKSSGNDGFQKYLFRITREVLLDIIRRLAGNHLLSPDSLSFLAEFYTFGIVGIIVQWAQNGMQESPQEISKNLRTLVNESKQFAVSRYYFENAEGEASPIVVSTQASHSGSGI